MNFKISGLHDGVYPSNLKILFGMSVKIVAEEEYYLRGIL